MCECEAVSVLHATEVPGNGNESKNLGSVDHTSGNRSRYPQGASVEV